MNVEKNRIFTAVSKAAFHFLKTGMFLDESWEVSCPLTISQVIEGLKKRVLNRDFDPPFNTSGKPFFGTIHSRGFSICKSERYRNQMGLMLDGKFNVKDHGVIINMELTLHPLVGFGVKAFMFGWVLFVLISGSIFIAKGNAGGLQHFFMFVLLPPVLQYAILKSQSESLKKFFDQTMEEITAEAMGANPGPPPPPREA